MPTRTLGEKPKKNGVCNPPPQTRARRVLSRIAVLVSIVASGYSPLASCAKAILTEGDVNPIVPTSLAGVWNVGGSLYIGQTGTGTLTITDGAVVNDSNGYIGQEPGSTGLANVSGAGSTWAEAGSLYVGNFGTGTLNISDGGMASSRDGFIGDNAGSSGAVTVSGAGSLWTNSRDLNIATSGLGSLVIEDGARVTSNLSYVGLDTSGQGTISVTGAGSTWANSGELSVGFIGTGVLSVQDGGQVSSAVGSIGNFFESTGRVLVSGTGSRWANSDALTVGNGGNGTLTLADGAEVSVQNGAGHLGLALFTGSSGTLNLGAATANPGDATQAGTLDVARVELGDGAGTLNFNHNLLHYDFAPVLASTGTGAHRLNQLAGTTVLTADNSGFNAITHVTGGTLLVANALGGSAAVSGGRLQVDGLLNGPVALTQTGTLSGVGTVSGSATFTNGGVLAGTQGQTLHIGGDLSLAGASQVNVALGGSATSALFSVTGDLTLDGTLNITSQGGFGLGVYRLFDYQGTLTDNGMTIGATPSGVASNNLTIQTTNNHQVNLVSTVGATLNFWDGGNTTLHNNGAVDGGTGVWRADGSNWTAADGRVNGPFQPIPNFAIFQGTAGVVSVDNSAGAIAVTGLQIATDGYRIVGAEIALQGGSESIIRVGDSSAASASMTGTLDANLSGASTLVKTDFGTLVLSGNNSYSGGTQIRGGVLSVSSDVNLGAAGTAITLDGGALASSASFASGRAINLAQLGEIAVASTTELTLSGGISGAGALYKSGAGTLVLTGINSYAGTRVESGTLIGNTQSLSGSLLNNASVVFDQPGDATYAGQITGRGTTTKRGAGALTLSGTSRQNWYIEDGTLISSAERYLGNTQIDAPGALRFEQAADATYGGVLSGNGSFTKTGNGQLDLTGNSSAFTGHTQITSGTLAVGSQAQLGGTLTLASGTTLQGTGSVGSTVLESGATLAPGPVIGTLSVKGDLTFSPGSTYRVEADPSSTSSDRIAVTGTANLAGSVVHVGPEGGFSSTREYTILTANSVQGTFATISSNYAYLDPTLRYSAQDVTLLLVRKSAAGAFASAGLTYNQRATANALDSLPPGNPLNEYILTLPAGTPPAVFDSLSGELHASVASSLRGTGMSVNALPLSRLSRRLHLAAGDADAPRSLSSSADSPTSDQPVWVEWVGTQQTLQGDGNAARLKQHDRGLFVGTSRPVGGNWQLGGALGYTRGDLRVDDRDSAADLDNYSALLFGGQSFEAGAGQVNLMLGAAYTWHDIATRRDTRVAGVAQRLTADYSASTTQVFSELGFAIPLTARLSVEPFAGLAWSDLRLRGFSESGGSAALSGRHSSEQQTSSILGVRAHSAFALAQVNGQLHGTLGWQHAFGEPVAQRQLAFAGSQTFSVAGVPITRNAARVELGADVALTPTTTLGLNLSGQYGDGNREQAQTLTLTWSY